MWEILFFFFRIFWTQMDFRNFQFWELVVKVYVVHGISQTDLLVTAQGQRFKAKVSLRKLSSWPGARCCDGIKRQPIRSVWDNNICQTTSLASLISVLPLPSIYKSTLLSQTNQERLERDRLWQRELLECSHFKEEVVAGTRCSQPCYCLHVATHFMLFIHLLSLSP